MVTKKSSAAETARLIAYSDAVIAIAVTFLALDLGSDLPDTLSGTDSSTTLTYLGENLSRYLGFGVCFLVVGYLWWRHHRMFRFIKRRSDRLMWVNAVFLATIALLPYPVAIIGRATLSPLAVSVFTIPMTVAGLALWGVWEVAHLQKLSVADGATIRNVRAALLTTPVAFGFATLFAIASWQFDQPWMLNAAYVCGILLFAPVITTRIWPLPTADEESALEQVAERDETIEAEKTESVLSRLREGTDSERMTAFTDGVYAIAVTVIALQITPPDASDSTKITSEALLENLNDHWAAILVYFITFFVIQNFWMAHLRVFDRIRAADKTLIWMNLIHLMFIAWMPFPAELQQFDGNEVTVSLYMMTLLSISLSMTMVSVYATRGRRLIDPHTPQTDIDLALFRGAYVTGVFAIATAVAVLGGSYNAFYAFFLFFFQDKVAGIFWPKARSGRPLG